MKVGTVKEIKIQEYRVGLTPNSVKAYIEHGHSVFVQSNAGEGSGYTNEEYEKAGATIVPDAAQIFENCDMVVKVKEPLEEEFNFLREGLILYTYLHIAANEKLTKALLLSKTKGVAYETIEDAKGNLPCLKPMSEIAGRLSIQEGAKYLEKPFGGRGVLLGGVPGVERGNVVIIGGGTVGTNACKMAVGMGAMVTVLDLSLERLEYLDDIFHGEITTLLSTNANVEDSLAHADLVIGAVLIHGAAAPKVIKRKFLKKMKKGAVIVDVAVDQGGCCETTHATYHDAPVFEVDGVVHYCVANMPGSVPRTSTNALMNATLPYGLFIADNGLENACKKNIGLAKGVNTYKGECTCLNVAKALNLKYTPVEDVMAIH